MSTANDPVVVLAVARTPMASFRSELAQLTSVQLGSVAIKGALSRAGHAAAKVDEVLMGCVLPAGVGQAPARQAAIGAGLSTAVPCTTISKVCGSGMKAVMLAHDALQVGSATVVVAGGMESMSNAPYLLAKGRAGYGFGHAEIFDHMMMDGLEDAYDIAPNGARRSMGTFGEDCAQKYGFTRAQQDAYAVSSVTRALKASESGAFAGEIVPVTVSAKGVDTVVSTDEGPRRIKVDKIPTLRTAFKSNGTITAASSSSINDGAAALVLARASTADKMGTEPLARIVGHASFAQEPGWFTTAPVFAIRNLCEKVGWTAASVDLFEVNEAFAVVAMAAMADLNIPRDKMNIHGGACALGHPIGATGARIIVTLIAALKTTGGKRGIASLCIGGGEATALAVELM